MNWVDHFSKVDNFLVIEEALPTSETKHKSIEINNGVRKKISRKRWEYIKAWHLIEPSASQLYVCCDLNTPHYQISPLERHQFLSSLSKLNHCSVIVYAAKEPITKTDFLTVVNDMSLNKDLQELQLQFSFNKASVLIEQYHEDGKSDLSRGNLFFDRGFSCGKNLTRRKDLLGLTAPRKRAVNKTMDKADQLYCDSMEQLLLQAMKKYLPGRCNGKESKLYMTPPSITKITNSEKQQFHASRYARTDHTHVLNVHLDTQNPQVNPEVEDSHMNMPVACFAVKSGINRCTVIGYGRESVVMSALRLDKFGPCLQSMVNFYNKIPQERKHITSDLVQSLQENTPSKEKPFRFNVHTDKMVYYSPFIDRLLKIFEFQNLNVYYRVALLYLTILSESPDLFMQETEVLLTDKSIAKNNDVFQFGYYFYRKIWDKKNAKAAMRKDKNKRHLVQKGGLRHAPTVNKEGTREGLVRSITIMSALHHACLNLNEAEVNDMFYFVRAADIFADTSNGVQHSGALMTQHLLVIGAAVGIYPSSFLTYGEMSNARNRTSYNERFGIFKDINKDDWSVESAVILKALCFHLGKTVMYCENLTCKEVQELRKTIERWFDSYYKGQRGLYETKICGNTEVQLQLVTPSSKTIIKLPTLMYPKKGDPLREEFQTLGVSFFTRTTHNKKASRKQKRANKFDEKISFKPLSPERVVLCSYKMREYILLDKMVIQALDMTEHLKSENFKAVTEIKKNTLKGKHVYVRWFRMSLNINRSKTKTKNVIYNVKDSSALLPYGFDTKDIKGQKYFANKSMAKEYLLLNYVIQHAPEQLSKLYSEVPLDDDEANGINRTYQSLMSLTNLARPNSHKSAKVPHYVLTPVTSTALVIYTCDENGKSSSDRHRWKPLKKYKDDQEEQTHTHKKRKKHT